MTMAAEKEGKYTPTQRRILHVLSDGLSHTVSELRHCIWDEQADLDVVIRDHISKLRKVLPKGQDVISRKRPDGEWGYSHVRVVKITGE